MRDINVYDSYNCKVNTYNQIESSMNKREFSTFKPKMVLDKTRSTNLKYIYTLVICITENCELLNRNNDKRFLIIMTYFCFGKRLIVEF